MIPEILAAAAVGLSFSNAWLCLGLSFGCRGNGPQVGARFILGRFIGLCITGAAISALGASAIISPAYLVAVFGTASVLFGVFILLAMFGGPGKFNRWLRHSLGIRRAGGCKIAPRPKPDETEDKDGARPGGALVLGITRGATPCVKMMVLAPLLIAVGPWNALLLTLVYAITSTVYPVIGFLSASALSYLPRNEKPLRAIGAAIMMLAGIFVIFNESFAYLSGGRD